MLLLLLMMMELVRKFLLDVSTPPKGIALILINKQLISINTGILIL